MKITKRKDDSKTLHIFKPETADDKTLLGLVNSALGITSTAPLTAATINFYDLDEAKYLEISKLLADWNPAWATLASKGLAMRDDFIAMLYDVSHPDKSTDFAAPSKQTPETYDPKALFAFPEPDNKTPLKPAAKSPVLRTGVLKTGVSEFEIAEYNRKSTPPEEKSQASTSQKKPRPKKRRKGGLRRMERKDSLHTTSAPENQTQISPDETTNTVSAPAAHAQLTQSNFLLSSSKGNPKNATPTESDEDTNKPPSSPSPSPSGT